MPWLADECQASVPTHSVQRLKREAQAAIAAAVEERILTALVGEHASLETRNSFRELYRCGHGAGVILLGGPVPRAGDPSGGSSVRRGSRAARPHATLRREGGLDDRMIEVEVPTTPQRSVPGNGGDNSGMALQVCVLGGWVFNPARAGTCLMCHVLACRGQGRGEGAPA